MILPVVHSNLWQSADHGGHTVDDPAALLQFRDIDGFTGYAQRCNVIQRIVMSVDNFEVPTATLVQHCSDRAANLACSGQ